MSLSPSNNNFESVIYDNRIVRAFAWATMIWGAVGMLVGVLIALQLASPSMNIEPWLTFGRLRPLHTNAVIFAFGGNAIFAGIYHSSQRLLKARLLSDVLSWLHFWGWQLIIVAAAISLPLGFTSGKEYAELEWPIDIAIAIVWVIFAINFFGTMVKRREAHIYVALWFYIASIITVAVLHIFNSLAIPFSWFKSYTVYAGAQDALVQWWYGHNAVAFFLTTPFLGLMYYYLPKAVERPVYSYRLSIVHFWSLVFLYIWAGPHHLLHTALPDWAQTLGMVFSVMLWMPSWGGMINGLLTLRGAWDKVRTDPVLKFFVVAITFYGMATFEGPLLSVKSVNALSHYTDWTIGHAHVGALGWNGFLTFGMFYWLFPRLYRTNLYSVRLAATHFWLGTIGIVVYVVSMWGAGVTQGLMLKAITPEGRLLYPDFVQTLISIRPLYWIRLIGGAMFLSGILIGIYNLYRTATQANAVKDDDAVLVPKLVVQHAASGVDVESAYARFHSWLEGKPLLFTALSVVAIVIGGIVEIIPFLTIADTIPAIASVKPYTPLEVMGRDIYVREGCYTCHSQMIRPFKDEVLRYGPYSRVGEFVYDHPFQWGSRRAGPDLQRVGGKYNHLWHYRHLEDPSSIAQGTLMPSYSSLTTHTLNWTTLPRRLQVLRKLGVPYTPADITHAVGSAKNQAESIGQELYALGQIDNTQDKEIVALIAYLQRLGVDYRASTTTATSAP